jgi:phosphoribosylglycinamide formyltransferase-1
MRIGLICSSGGSVFSSAYKLLKRCNYNIQAVIVTDRACGIESFCRDMNLPFERIEEADSEIFSAKAAEFLFKNYNVNWVAIFFSRLISSILYKNLPCVNFHPSLLPNYPGFGALKFAHQNGEKLIGATAHFVDQSIDGGPILAQISTYIPKNSTLNFIERISYAQKLYLMLVIFESAFDGKLLEKFNFIKNNSDIHEFNIQDCVNLKIKNIMLEKEFIKYLEKEEIQWNMQ